MTALSTSKPGARPLRALSEAERSTLVNALRVAGEEYDKHAASILVDLATNKPSEAERVGYGRIMATFQRQAVEARALAEIIEQTDEITVRK